VRYIASIGDQKYLIEINADGSLTVEGKCHRVDFCSVAEQPIYSLLLDGKSYEALVQSYDYGIEIQLRGQHYLIKVEDERQHRLRQTTGAQLAITGEFHLKSPMPGMVIDVHVTEGQSVSSGEQLIVLESMKMQNEIRAPQEGIVRSIRVRAGERVEQNQILLTIG
jgi:biotin carboxyl carrier protein